MTRRLLAEYLGTFFLVFAGCGSQVVAGRFPEVDIGILEVALAFGLAVLTMTYALGHVSGAHFNPAVSVGLWSGGMFPGREIAPYAAAQLAGAVTGSAVLFVVASGKAGFNVAAGFAANGYGAHSPGGYSMGAALVSETVLTFFFVAAILGSRHNRAPAGFDGIASGLALTLVHLVGIPITNTSVNPARATGPAVFVGGWALAQLWLFWAAPITGAFLAGKVSTWLSGGD